MINNYYPLYLYTIGSSYSPPSYALLFEAWARLPREQS